MKRLFDELSFEMSRATTKKYSTSFSLGILALSPTIRPAIYSIYGFVRLADEIVDSFHTFNKAELLDRFVTQTNEALEEGISLNPILNSFQSTVREFGIERQLIDQFLHSMHMDLNDLEYDVELYDEYILGSAEVVGLMCLRVFVHGDQAQYEKLKPYAMKLGSAFQKVNFLRDIKDDNEILGRSYFPYVQTQGLNSDAKKRIEIEIALEFKEALLGIKLLPETSRFGVYLAYRYYLCLFRKICDLPAERVLMERVRVPNGQKFSIMLRSYVQYKLTVL